MKLSQNSQTESTNKDSTLMNLMNKGESFGQRRVQLEAQNTRSQIGTMDIFLSFPEPNLFIFVCFLCFFAIKILCLII